MENRFLKAIEKGEAAGQKFCLNISSRFLGDTSGVKFGRNTGNSLEYLDHREYQPGDDVRHIDWNALARSDKLTVKLYREEISPHLDLIIDASSSMDLEDTSKAEGMWGQISLFKVAALNGGFSFCPWVIKDRCRRIEPSNLDIRDWPDVECNFNGNSGQTLVNFPPRLKPRGVRILISDLFWEEEPMKVLQQLSDQAAMLIVMQIVAKEDLNPSVVGNTRVIDSETGEAIELTADDSILSIYQKNLARHLDYWKRCCTKTGAIHVMTVAENFLSSFMPLELLAKEVLISGG
jgi:hypothetical protein